MERGTVQFYKIDKGFGFIQPDAGGKDVFLHARALPEGFTPSPGDRVAFACEMRERGPFATRAEALENDA